MSFESFQCDIRKSALLNLQVYIVLTCEERNWFFFMIPEEDPGTKIVNVKFREIKLKKVIRNLPLFEPDRNKSILSEGTKPSYPPSSFKVFLFPKCCRDA